MSVIPGAPGHVAKASTCSDSVSTHGRRRHLVLQHQEAVQAEALPVRIIALPHGGSKSSFTDTSAPSLLGRDESDSNGAVSCSAHAP